MLRSLQQLIEEASQQLRRLSAEQAWQECQQSNGVLIDVRESAEVAEKPVPNATAIPRGILEMQALQRFPDPSQALYLHCASGVRAALAAEQLQRLGYRNVTAISCNIDAVRACCSENSPL